MKFYIELSGVRYSEMDQTNPMRWMLLEEVEPGCYKNTTDPFKCKDYFNDFVAYKVAKIDNYIYGMNSRQAHFDKNGGLNVLVLNVSSDFAHNVHTTLNPELERCFGFRVLVTDVVPDSVSLVRDGKYETAALLYLPNAASKSVYRISLVTAMIRSCNRVGRFTKYSDMLDLTFYTAAHMNCKTHARLLSGNLESELEDKYWFYYNNDMHSDTTRRFIDINYIHNSGIMTYLADTSNWTVADWNVNTEYFYTLSVSYPEPDFGQEEEELVCNEEEEWTDDEEEECA